MNSNLTIRNAAIEDLPALLGIRKTAILAQPETIWTRAGLERAAGFYDNATAGDFSAYRVFVAQYGGKPAGFVGREKDYLGFLFILPEFQGSGLGRQLLELIEQDMRVQGLGGAWLWAHPYAERFYARHGYQQAQETSAPFGLTLNKFHKRFQITEA